ncbi:MAG: hypothetical protein Q9174_005799 [Haloplaca sp. 1 TL-2023]
MPTLLVSDFNIVCATLGGLITLFGLVSYLFKERYYLSEARKIHQDNYHYFSISQTNRTRLRRHLLPPCPKLDPPSRLCLAIRRKLG